VVGRERSVIGDDGQVKPTGAPEEKPSAKNDGSVVATGRRPVKASPLQPAIAALTHHPYVRHHEN
jgi:hypothetical protein